MKKKVKTMKNQKVVAETLKVMDTPAGPARVVYNQMCHGDVLVVYHPEGLPKNVVQRKKTADTVVGHSESGHHHVLRNVRPDQIWDLKGRDVCFLKLEGDGDLGSNPIYLEHLRTSPKPHDPTVLGKTKGVWEFRGQFEETPEGWQRVLD